MWLLIVVAYALGDGPDFRFAPPIEVHVKTEAACHDAAREMANDATRQAGVGVSIVYDCRPPKGTPNA
jgi:hypothetical protein